MNLVIRPEQPQDTATISAITQIAFKDHPYSHQTEHLIIDALRAADALTMSLVAGYNDEVVGHVAFSLVTVEGLNVQWYGLGPISVRPDLQRKGIGLKLIETGLRQLREMGAQGCVLVGEPDYYRRTGFKAVPQLKLPGVPEQFFLALPFGEQIPSGLVRFHPAFEI